MKTGGERGLGPLGGDEVVAVVAWLRTDGDAAVLVATHLSKQGLYRAAAGLDVHPGTRSLVRAALAARAST